MVAHAKRARRFTRTRMYRTLIVLGALVCLQACAYRQGLAEVSYGTPEVVSIVHPKRDRARWYIRWTSDAFGERFFFLDTGYGNTTCDDDFIAELQLQTRGKVLIFGESGKTRATKAILPPFTLGGHQIDRVVCTVRDLNTTSSIKDNRSFPISGVLGMDVLRRFRTLFHPDTAQMWLYHPESGAPIRDGIKLGREYGFGLRATIRTQINEKTRALILDTGASITLANGKGLNLSDAKQLTASVLQGSGTGKKKRAIQRYQIDQLGIAGLEPSSGILYDRRRGPFVFGLLGLNVLNLYRQEYDWQTNRARFTPIDKAKIPLFERSTSE